MGFASSSRIAWLHFGDAASLVACAFQVDLARPAAAVWVGHGGRTIRSAAHDVLVVHLAGVPVIESDNRHAEMQQIGDDREESGFLPAMLRAARGEGTPHIAVKGTAHPQSVGLVEEYSICDEMRPKRVPVPTMMVS